MKTMTIRLVMAVSVLLFMALPTLGDEPGLIDVQLTVQKVEHLAGAQEHFVSAETIRPGDVLQYELVYKIKGEDQVLELLAQLPVPEGMEYIPNSAQPPQVLASLNGTDFSPVPLQRKVKMSNGQEAPEEIPTLEYRCLGWPMRGFAPGDKITVSARMKVNFIPEPTKAF